MLCWFQIGVRFSPAVLIPGVFASTAEDMIFAVSYLLSWFLYRYEECWWFSVYKLVGGLVLEMLDEKEGSHFL